MKDETLLPCPFCGSPAEHYPDGDMEGYSIMCSHQNGPCNMLAFGYETPEEAEIAWNTRAALQSGNSAQPVTVPEGDLQKAIFAACLVFLYSCNNGKSYEDTFYDPTTEYYLDISVIAEEIGVVQVMGNRRWLPSKEMQDEIEGVYRKYAMRIMEAAPKVTP